MPAGRDPAREASQLTAAIVERVMRSAKYRGLDSGLVQRIAEQAADRFRDRNQALKYAKRKLHQAAGAFRAGSPSLAVLGCIDQVLAGSAPLRPACQAAMAAHASTAERVPWLDQFYGQLAAWCGPVTSMLDLACGLNPLAIPWMSLAPGASYWCCEIDAQLVAALGRLGEILPVSLTSATVDLVADPPARVADVALLLKTVTTLEQQRAGASRALLDAIDCRHVIVSLPRASLSGGRSYRDDAEGLVGRLVRGSRYEISDRAHFGDELVWHLRPVAPPAARVLDEPGAAVPAGPRAADPERGELTLIGTPIGSLGDLTPGALAALRAADVICAEDTRRTRKLLSAYDVHPARLVSLRAQNEVRVAERVIGWLIEGKHVGYVTDAGMPGISDPGQRLAAAVLAAGERLAGAPGPDAASTALLLAGHCWDDEWCFEGFLPPKGGDRAIRLRSVAAETMPCVVYEAPHRLLRTLTELAQTVGEDRPVVVANDLTKRYEHTWRGPAGSAVAALIGLTGGAPKGEYVIVVLPASPSG